jgi:hypothetical protein
MAVVRAPRSFLMSLSMRLEASQDRKREGDALFGRGSYEQAAAVYCNAGALLDDAVPGRRPRTNARTARRADRGADANATPAPPWFAPQRCRHRPTGRQHRPSCACAATGGRAVPAGGRGADRGRRVSVCYRTDADEDARKAGVMRMILLQNRAACCHKLGDFADAVELCTKGIHGGRTCRIARDVVALGGCCARARRAALTPRGTVSAALRCEPRAEQALLLRGRCLMAMGDYFAAYCDYWELAALKPDALEPQQQMQAIAAVCPEVLEEHRAKNDLDGLHGTGLASKFAQFFALSGAGVLAFGWTVLAGLSLFATPPASTTTSSSASAASTWGLRVLGAWGDLFSALSLVSVAVLPIVAVILPWPSTERGTNCVPAPYSTLSRPFAVFSCLASRSASAVIWCLLVPLLVSDGNLVATRGGLFGVSGGGGSWVHLLISSTVVHGLITAARIPLQVVNNNNNKYIIIINNFHRSPWVNDCGPDTPTD